MAIIFQTPQQTAQDYLTHLQSLQPQINTSQQDSDWYIRAQVVGGLFAGVYADQRLLANDPFPQSARHDALGRHLFTYFGNTSQGSFLSATNASGYVAVFGASGSVLTSGTQFSFTPNGNTYQATASATLAGATGNNSYALVPVVSLGQGQAQNLLSGAPLTVSNPPAGILSSASASGNLADGTDAETDAEAAARILARIQQPPAGGTASDYAAWAESVLGVTSASILRFPFGYGTVGIVITSGTTDIDEALNNGQDVVQFPSQSLIDQVQAYIDSVRPLNDCAYVMAPSGVTVNATVAVTYASGVPGDGTIPPGQTLTQDQLVQREVQRAIYKTPAGGVNGYVIASTIEQTIDAGLSASGLVVGLYAQIVTDRQIQPLSASGYNFPLLGTQLPQPGIISVIPLVP